ncbi:hypothetical protein RchiOBHm_Chr5g0023061 [Rosa chinensis]|uniref:Uncharacterized protein n=1 Tax=Rosa chinensis TaxID=74649 RepID=A0A2P6Q7Z5_ROSCH|nr:hypothetical protein RchiOBHm_Chr5g0023061 [Rosa chinensis]
MICNLEALEPKITVLIGLSLLCYQISDLGRLSKMDCSCCISMHSDAFVRIGVYRVQSLP